jgi:hypothetical protein
MYGCDHEMITAIVIKGHPPLVDSSLFPVRIEKYSLLFLVYGIMLSVIAYVFALSRDMIFYIHTSTQDDCIYDTFFWVRKCSMVWITHTCVNVSMSLLVASVQYITQILTHSHTYLCKQNIVNKQNGICG